MEVDLAPSIEKAHKMKKGRLLACAVGGPHEANAAPFLVFYLRRSNDADRR